MEDRAKQKQAEARGWGGREGKPKKKRSSGGAPGLSSQL